MIKKLFLILLFCLLQSTAFAAVIDSYSETNQDRSTGIGSVGDYKEVGQCFTLATNATISGFDFYMKKEGTPTGNMTAYLYAATGTMGSSAIPTGNSLASKAVDVSGLTGDFVLLGETDFDTPYEASAGDYCVSMSYITSGAPNYVRVGGDGSSPSHSGNSFFTFTIGADWEARAGVDTCFYLYGDVVAVGQIIMIE